MHGARRVGDEAIGGNVGEGNKVAYVHAIALRWFIVRHLYDEVRLR